MTLDVPCVVGLFQAQLSHANLSVSSGVMRTVGQFKLGDVIDRGGAVDKASPHHLLHSFRHLPCLSSCRSHLGQDDAHRISRTK